MTTLNEKELAEIRDHFDFFDADGDGYLDLKEFRRLFRVLAPDAGPGTARRGFALIDEDGSGKIDFDEFAQWWALNWTVF